MSEGECEMTLDNDATFNGSLSRDWNGDYMLKTNNGTIRFSDFKTLTIPPQNEDK